MNILNLIPFFLFFSFGMFYIRRAFKSYEEEQKEPRKHLVYSDFIRRVFIGVGSIFMGFMHFFDEISWFSDLLEILIDIFIN